MPRRGDDPLRRMLLRLPVTLLLGILVWLAVRPALDRTVAVAAQALLHAHEAPPVTRLVESRHWVEVRRADLPRGAGRLALPLTGVHFNTIVLLALALALPRPWSRRQLESLAMAWAVLLLTQVLNLTLEVKSLYATRLADWSLANYPRLARDVLGFLQLFFDLPVRFAAPFVLWYAFNAEAVHDLLGGDDPAGPR